MGENFAEKWVFPKESAEGNQFLEEVEEQSTVESEHIVEGTKLKDLWANLRMRSNLIFSAVIWCALIVNYYIVTFYLKYFPGSLFTNSLTMAFSDIVSYGISKYVLDKLGLIKSVIASLSTAGIGSILYFFFFHEVSLIPFFIILCRIGNSMLLNIMYVTNNTLFPT